MRSPSFLSLAVILATLAFTAAPLQAQIQIGTGSLAASSQWSAGQPYPGSGSNQAPNVTLNSGSPSGSLSSMTSGTWGNYSVVASISLNASVTSSDINFSYTGESSDGYPYFIATATGSIDVTFILNAPATLELSGVFNTIWSIGQADILNSQQNTVESISRGAPGGSPAMVYASVGAGTYELQATLTADYNTGTGGPSSGSFDVLLAPEPSAVFLLAPLVFVGRRRTRTSSHRVALGG
jgi:hypothetical protein